MQNARAAKSMVFIAKIPVWFNCPFAPLTSCRRTLFRSHPSDSGHGECFAVSATFLSQPALSVPVLLRGHGEGERPSLNPL